MLINRFAYDLKSVKADQQFASFFNSPLIEWVNVPYH